MMGHRGHAVIVLPKGTERECQQTVCRCDMKLSDLGYRYGGVMAHGFSAVGSRDLLISYYIMVTRRDAVVFFALGWENDPMCQEIEQLAKEDKVKRLYET